MRPDNPSRREQRAESKEQKSKEERTDSIEWRIEEQIVENE
jgi:hypothetical protein